MSAESAPEMIAVTGASAGVSLLTVVAPVLVHLLASCAFLTRI